MTDSLSFGTALLLGLIGDFISDIYRSIGIFITEIYTYTVEINQIAEVELVANFTTFFGMALCSLVVIKQMIGTYGIGTEGDADQNPVEIIFRLCKALAIMAMNSWLFTELLRFSSAVGRDITKAMLGDTLGISFYDTIEEQIISQIVNSPMLAICGIVIVIGLILFSISACLRAAELTLNKVLLPLFCLDILNSNPEKWKMFCFQYGMGFFSYLVQMFCYNVFVILCLRLNLLDMKQFIVLFGWLVLSIRGTKILEKYIYATGTGRGIGQGASRIGQVLMYTRMRG